MEKKYATKSAGSQQPVALGMLVLGRMNVVLQPCVLAARFAANLM